MDLEIIYQDKDIVAINKPHGLLVHRSAIAREVSEFALQKLRDQLNRHVFPCHRLDRKTGGVLLFALEEEMLKNVKVQFMNQEVGKHYTAIVRGYTDDSGEIDYPLTRDDGKKQEAFTSYKTLARTEIPVALGKFNTQRYSLLSIAPLTGRMHQIRKHFAHIFHPIIGDRPHGCNKQNKLFKEQWNMTTMLLHCTELRFKHPSSSEDISITASLQEEFKRSMEILKFTACTLDNFLYTKHS